MTAQPAEIGFVGMGVDSSVITDEFVVSKRQTLTRMASRFAVLPLGAGVIVVLACVAAGCIFDLRWVILGLMAGMVMLPAVATFLYFSYGMRPECFVNILPHTVTVSPAGITVTLYIEEKNDDAVEAEAGADTEVRRRTVDYTFAVDRGRPYSAGAKSICINLANPCKGFIHIPYGAFGDSERLKKAVDILIAYKSEL